MEISKKINSDLESIAWGAFLVLWGATELVDFFPQGTGAIGVGLILIGLNIARYRKGLPTSGFTTFVGALAFIWGLVDLSRPYLHLTFDLPVFAILLLAFGVMIIGKAALRARGE